MGNVKETPYEFRFAIVEFESNSSSEELLPIDLVPGSWVKKSKDKYMCKYPPKKDFENVEKWTKEEKNPEVHWKRYRCTPIHGAVDFSQGKRRLRRAYETRNCASTDCESQIKGNMPVVISESAASQMLHSSMPMHANVKNKQTCIDTGALSQNSRIDDNVAESSQKNWRSSSTLNLQSRNKNKADQSSDSDDSIFMPRSAIKNNKAGNVTGNRSTRSRHPSYGQSESDAKDSEGSRSDGIDSTAKGSEENVSTNEGKTSGTSGPMKLDDALTEFINRKFQELETSFQRNIKSSKDSILYNIQHQMDELKLAIVASNVPQIPKGTVQDMVMAVKTPLPITSLEEFQQFDKALSEDQEQKDALFALFQYLCFEHPTSQKCIEHVLPKIFTRAVQGKYSGQGKKAKGFGKLNFSATATFECFNAVILAKFGEANEAKNLKTKIGVWLAHFADREGGRKQRCNTVE